MSAREPAWWYGEGQRWQATLLSPVAGLVGGIAAARLRKPNPYRSRLPVICVGNFTAGGTGKTPMALLLAKLVTDRGREPWFLSRGYGGRLAGPLRVDPATHRAAEVGDEPLLLARHAPAFISRNRRKGAQAIETIAPPNAVIIMDDGLQNPALVKDLTIAVIDADRGFGNGHVIPAGPMRAPLAAQIGLARVIVLTGQARTADSPFRRSLLHLTAAPIISAETQSDAPAEEFRGRKVLAYAGIANPQRFFVMLESQGAVIAARRTFPDHHNITNAQAQELLDAARLMSASLITTEKDLVRLAGASGPKAALREQSKALPIKSVVEGDDLKTLNGLIAQTLNS